MGFDYDKENSYKIDQTFGDFIRNVEIYMIFYRNDDVFEYYNTFTINYNTWNIKKEKILKINGNEVIKYIDDKLILKNPIVNEINDLEIKDWIKNNINPIF